MKTHANNGSINLQDSAQKWFWRFSQQQLQQGAPPVIYANRGSMPRGGQDENIRGNNTPLIVQLMRLARLTQNCLVVIDDCAAELMVPGSKQALCLNNFLCGLLQSLPKLRILLTALEPPFVITKKWFTKYTNKPQLQTADHKYSWPLKYGECPSVVASCTSSNFPC